MAIFSGDIFAEQYVISSSVTNVTIGSVSGSTAFGDTTDDTHQFTGSLKIHSGSIDINSSSSPNYAIIGKSSTGQQYFKIRNGNSESFPIGVILLNYGSGNLSTIRAGSNQLRYIGGENTSAGSHIFLAGNNSTEIAKFRGSDGLTVSLGNISGSSTSTGSFGRGVIADTLEVGSTYGTAPAIKSNNGIELGSIGASNSFLSFSGNQDISIRGDGSSNLYFKTGNEFIFRRHDQSGGNRLVVSSTKVSGSATSTGSFGKLSVKNADYGGMIEWGDTYKARIYNPSDSFVTLLDTAADFRLQARNVEIQDNNGNSKMFLQYNSEPQIYSTTGSFKIFAGTTSVADGGSKDSGGGFGFLTSGGTHAHIFATAYRPGGNNGNYGVQFHNSYANKATGSLLIKDSAKIDLLTLDGAIISGSSTSTGSFGQVKVGTGTEFRSEGFTIDGTKGDLTFDGTSAGGGAFLTLNGGAYNTVFTIKRTSNSRTSALKFDINGNDKFAIGQFDSDTGYSVDNLFIAENVFGTDPHIEIQSTSGNVVFHTANQKISGSSTSTGSFGKVYAVKKVAIGEINSYNNPSDLKLDIKGSSSDGVIVQIQNTSGGNPAGVTYNHIGPGYQYAWYAGTMDGSNGHRKFTIGVGQQPGYSTGLTVSSTSLLELSEIDSSATFKGNVSSSATSTGSFGHVVITSAGDALELRSSGPVNTAGNTVSLDFTTNVYPTAGRNVYFDASQDSSNRGKLTIGAYGTVGGSTAFYDILQIHAQDGNAVISGSAISTGSFGMLRVGDNGGNLELRTKSANIAIGNLNTYPDFRDTSGGNYNIAIGTEVFMDLTSGERNTGVGYQAGRHNVGGDYNSFFGWNAGRGTSTGTHTGNTALGYQTLFSLNTGGNNVAVGRNALYQLDKGSDSVGIGKSAGYYATGSYNTFVGSEAGKGGQTSAPYSSGQYNVAMGYQALEIFTTGYSNTAVGYQALTGVGTGFRNTALGHGAGLNLTTGNSNVAVGHNSLKLASTTSGQVAIGSGALHSVQAGTGNVGLGQNTLYQNSSGNNNVAIGHLAGFFGSAKTENVLIGLYAGYNATGSFNTFVGSQAGMGGQTSAPYSSGQYNTAVGKGALAAFTTGTQNIMVGSFAGDAITTGGANVAIGYAALSDEDTGARNVAIGHEALRYFNYDGEGRNVALGYRTSYYRTTGVNNTMLGYYAGFGVSGQTTGYGNTGVGYSTLTGITSGNNNTAVGTTAGNSITTGGSNVLLGHGAGDAITTKTGVIAIGSGAASAISTTGDYTIAIGHGAMGGAQIGDGNIAIGYQSMQNANSSALHRNTAIGYQTMANVGSNGPDDMTVLGYRALYSVTTGGGNTAVGSFALSERTTGARNVAVGKNALSGSATGNNSVAIGVDAMKAGASGSDNVAIGYQALLNDQSKENVAIGSKALYTHYGLNNGFRGRNVAIGHEAMYNATTSDRSVAIGFRAGYKKKVNGGQVYIGNQAGYNEISGSANTAVGGGAGQGFDGDNQYGTSIGFNSLKTTGGSKNYTTVVGAYAAFQSTFTNETVVIGDRAAHGAAAGTKTLTNMVIIGSRAAQYARNPSQSVIIGSVAVASTNVGPITRNVIIGSIAANVFGAASGSDTVMIGYESGHYATGSYNTFVGSYAGKGGQTSAPYSSGQYNVAVGYQALDAFTTGKENVAVGSNAGGALTTGYTSTFVGHAAGASVTTAGNNNYFGYAAGLGTTGGGNVGIGNHVMKNGAGAAADNTAVGGSSLYAITTGTKNTTLGQSTGEALTTTSNTVLIGWQAGYAINSTDADGTVAIGYQAGTSITSGQKSTLVGYLSGHKMTIADANTAIGYKSLGGNTSSALGVGGNSNVAVGYFALAVAFDNCQKNVAVGNQSLESLTNGKYNTALGAYAGDNLTTGTANTYLGYYALPSAVDVTDEILIKAGQGTSMTGGGTETVRIGVETDYITNDFGENATWTHSSDRRVKKDIKDTNIGLDFILKLQPKEFKKKAPSEYPPEFEQYNAEITERKNPDKIHYGFVAQEVKEAMDLVGHSEFPVWKENRDGMQELGEAELITPLVKAVQELSSENKELKDELNELKIFIKKKLGDE